MDSVRASIGPALADCYSIEHEVGSGTIAGGPGAQRGGGSRVLACDGGVGSGRTRVREAATTSRATGREPKQVNYDWRNTRPSD